MKTIETITIEVAMPPFTDLRADASYRRHVLCNRTILFVAVAFGLMLIAAVVFAGRL